MTNRYALRFEEGERRGEIVALTGSTTTFGRKPGNSVQVLDASVSGKHAEVLVDADGVLVRDLGSTNGTRVNGERISEKRVKLGDRVMFGTIDFVLLDASAPSSAARPAAPGEAEDIGLELEADEPLPRPTGRPAGVEATMIVNSLRNPGGEADAGEAVRSIGADKLAKSGKKSAVAAVVLILLGGGAAGAWWFTSGRQSGGTTAQNRAVVDVPGNLLSSGYSFEGPELPDGWSNHSSATSVFETDRAARASGKQGLAAEVSRAVNARLESEIVQIRKGARLACSLGTQGAVEARAGLRFEASSSAYLPVEAWGPWLGSAGEGGLQDYEFQAAVPDCYDRARVVIAARGGTEAGVALLDNVSILSGASAPARAVKFEDVELMLLGEPAGTAFLFKIDHPLLSGIRFATANGGEAALAAEQDPLGMRISSKEGSATLEFIAEAGTAAGGISTTGRDGFKTHQAQFERADVDSLLVGAGRELVRLRFNPPVTVRGRPEAGASFLLEAIGATSAQVQVTFNEERVAAESLASNARAAARSGTPGEVISIWSRLINEHPIDAQLIAEAEAGRAKALSGGLAEVAAVRGEVERARFFRLLALFRECREGALKIAKSYAGSEVEGSALALAENVAKDIELLARDLDQLEAGRLAQIHSALVASGQTRLAERVAQELKTRFQVSDPASFSNAPQAGVK